MYSYSCQNLMKYDFFNRFSKSTHISNFVKIRPVEAKFFHSDELTEMTKLVAAYRYFGNAPKSCPVTC
jgi:hypothetical protein